MKVPPDIARSIELVIRGASELAIPIPTPIGIMTPKPINAINKTFHESFLCCWRVMAKDMEATSL